jgi:hypothetical protein
LIRNFQQTHRTKRCLAHSTCSMGHIIHNISRETGANRHAFQVESRTSPKQVRLARGHRHTTAEIADGRKGYGPHCRDWKLQKFNVLRQHAIDTSADSLARPTQTRRLGNSTFPETGSRIIGVTCSIGERNQRPNEQVCFKVQQTGTGLVQNSTGIHHRLDANLFHTALLFPAKKIAS